MITSALTAITELRQIGEHRTQGYVLHAHDQMARDEAPELEGRRLA